MTVEDAYSFDPFFERLSADWYGDDALLTDLVAAHADEPEAAAARLGRWGEICAGRLSELAEASALPENRPRLRHYDARGNRVDRVVLPDSTSEALGLVEGDEGLGAASGDPFVHYAAVYLASQNGEAGVACSVACTDGLVRALEAVGDRAAHERPVAEVRGSTAGHVVHGAQFVTEIQGGSDVPANRTRAEPAGDGFRLYGRKWFCSNVNADWYLVTARPDGAPEGPRGVGLFLVEARRERDRPGRNGHTVDRLKDKLGTRELPTAEITFDGAEAHPVGPLERGLPVLLRHVLVPSRYGCVLFAAAALRRAERVASTYAEFREAFGRPIAEYPRVEGSLRAIARGRARSLAASFRLLGLWERARAAEGWDDPGARPEREDPAAADFRVMLSLCKTVLTRRATRLLHEAMMLLGGNGIEERFSPLPRLHRDMVIMETWEGPHNVLLAQALRDLGRYGEDARAFVERVAGPGREGLADELAALLAGKGEAPPTVSFGPLAGELVSAFADRALEEAGAG